MRARKVIDARISDTASGTLGGTASASSGQAASSSAARMAPARYREQQLRPKR